MESMSKGSIGSKVDSNEINDASEKIIRHLKDNKQAITNINLLNNKNLAKNKKKEESNEWKLKRGSNVSQSQEPVKHYFKKSVIVDKNKQN
jgi:hypothetical protein